MPYLVCFKWYDGATAGSAPVGGACPLTRGLAALAQRFVFDELLEYSFEKMFRNEDHLIYSVIVHEDFVNKYLTSE